MRVVRAAFFLGSVLGLFAAKLGEELDVSVLWVELARTIILSIKLRWRNRVDLNRDHRLSIETQRCQLQILLFKRIMMQLLDWLII